nr:immunoglobulin-like domain-containing protein [Evansella tamaricis]
MSEENDESIETILALSRSQFVADVVPPVITLNGQNPLTLELGSTYVEPGFTANDDLDGDLTDAVVVSGSVNINEIGEYSLVYTVTDNAGNEGDATRVVRVVDTTAPIITLDGANPLSLDVGSPFVEPGYSAVDNLDGNLTDQVEVTGEVDVHSPGEYTLIYTVYDSEGNKGEVTRTVIVKDKKIEVIAEPPTKNNTEDKDTELAKLPDTATNSYNMLIAGILISLLGGFMLFFKRKRAVPLAE